MEIKVCKTTEWSDHEWKTFVDSFISVFKREVTIESFKKNYTTNVDGTSYHALLLNDGGDVVGSCSVSPQEYYYKDRLIRLGLAVGVFIRDEYRMDPLVLRKMYKKLATYLKRLNILAVIAVPNAIAYPYWKNVVKWKDVGAIRYWALPVHIGAILHKAKFLNLLSKLYAYSVTYLSCMLSVFVDSRKSDSVYRIHDDAKFLKHRFLNDCYQCFENKDVLSFFRIVEEEGVRTAYIIYCKEKGQLSFRAFSKTTLYILKSQKIDMVLYIGQMNMFQTLFVRVPSRLEPKLLPLTCDIINEDSGLEGVYDLKNWDFGLVNYDVR